MNTGVITYLNPEKGFGFLKSETDGTSVHFVNFRTVGFGNLKINDKVNFIIYENGPKGPTAFVGKNLTDKLPLKQILMAKSTSKYFCEIFNSKGENLGIIKDHLRSYTPFVILTNKQFKSIKENYTFKFKNETKESVVLDGKHYAFFQEWESWKNIFNSKEEEEIYYISSESLEDQDEAIRLEKEKEAAEKAARAQEAQNLYNSLKEKYKDNIIEIYIFYECFREYYYITETNLKSLLEKGVKIVAEECYEKHLGEEVYEFIVYDTDDDNKEIPSDGYYSERKNCIVYN